MPTGVATLLSFVLLMLFYSFAPARKSSRAFRLGEWLSRSVLTFFGSQGQVQSQNDKQPTDPGITKQAYVPGKYGQMNTKLALGLIVLTAIGTYEVSRAPRHHFEPTKLGNGSILIDTETGVECSARFGMKWTDEDKKAVWAAGLAAKKAEKQFGAFDPSTVDLSARLDSGSLPYPVAADSPCGDYRQNGEVKACDDLFITMQDADSNYNRLVEKANAEEVPDPTASYFKDFPLCKDLR